ncbi:non-ribosomal peptide synthetase [Neorhodopirellula pilleata]|uniref:Dimodular nonribosomal peptide synthase n=1 Tax=Neorhodopirellula pilleata TaxID=2714738 RepID=A0A5C6A2T6_9BACT|nr:non-ribosomal peptide synthetase [Neorhodopirellula pilleata]TWT93637.1 Dimodular nonribosomal peptide synthase [Neorhodopirellula pilleata]
MITIERNSAAKSAVAKLLAESSGLELDELNQQASFPELGFDSLFLVQFSQKIKSQLKVKVTFRQLIEEIPNIQSLIGYVSENLPEDLVAANGTAKQPSQGTTAQTPAPTAATPEKPQSQTNISHVDMQPDTPSVALSPIAPEIRFSGLVKPMTLPAGSAVADKAVLAQIIAQQNQLMSLQLQLLSGTVPSVSKQDAPPTDAASGEESNDASIANAEPVCVDPGATENVIRRVSSEQSVDSLATKKTFERFGPYKPVRRANDGGLTVQQQENLDALIARFTAKTARSRQHAQQHRSHFADPRGVAGYRRIWKSMVYQIAVDKSKGSKLWDIDGNEYIDIAMGFGLNLFGQSPDFINDAIAKQLSNGVEVGPQSPLAGEVAALLCDFSRKERATFCNTGSEAVMAAMRLARTVTGKSKIVFFNKDYHGNFDQVLIRSNLIGNRRLSQPAAPGVPQAFADQVIVLDYGTEEALQTIRDRADEIAAVLIEPVQSADPFTQPKEFLQEIRRITKEHQIAMVMDEVITGFRAAPGGAQEWFGVWGDMATYGKVLGGGLPIGALAGSSEYMDALDGGNWNYDDDSEPEADMTFFAGTFVRHPLAMTAAYQVLMKIKESGPELQQELTDNTTYLVDSLNQFFEQEIYPFRLAQFTSLFRFMFPPTVEFADLLYFHLLDRGIFTRGWGDNCFLSTAHDKQDVQRIIDAVKDSCNEMRRGGFLPERPESDEKQVSLGNATDALKKKRSRFPLTEAQLEIWITSQMGDEASCSYNEPFTVRFRGNLNVERLCNSIQAVTDRHSSLHACFDKDGEYQCQNDPAPVEVSQEDISGFSDDKRQSVIDETARWFGSTPFDLTIGPLIRLKLVKLADEDHVLFFSAHHIVSDGWSTGLMLNEICEVYTALTEHRDAELPEPAHFADYVAMESDDDEDARQALDFWLNRYRELPDPLELPYDRPRPPIKSFTGSTLIYQFDSDVYHAIKKVAADNNATLFTLTFSALNVLLARLSGQNDIVVTIPTAGQVMAENSCLVGHCVNLLPIRSHVSLQDSFDYFMKSTQTAVLDAYDHQQCTLGRIVRELRMPRDPSRLPLVEVNFNLDRDGAGLKFPDLEIEVAQTVKTTSTFELFFNLNETDHGLELYLDYASALFDETTIQRWIAHYETLLRSIAENTSGPIGDLSLLGAEDNILISPNETITDYPRDLRFVDLFERQVDKTPHAIAITCEGEEITYRELNCRVNRVANGLIRQGAGRDQLIGVRMQRGVDMVVALLGIQKSGAAYVPLDPTYPDQRLAFIVQDAGIELVLHDIAAFEKDEQSNPEPASAANDLAYVIFTSGSTGKPKGVQIEHRSLTNFLCSMSERPGICADDVLVAVTTVSFDIASLELYLPLMVGAKIVLATNEQAMDARALSDLLTRSNATVLQATPATWRILLESGFTKPTLKALCGGEQMTRELAQQLLPCCRELWNMYGPTETTIWSLVQRVQPGSGYVPIGSAIANTQVYLLDDRLQPVPTGVAGRLYLGGDGLARGYLNRDDLTAEKFVPHPFADNDSRIYDTGDKACWRPDGSIEFLGRADNQVKVRGFRIELGEIEQNLKQHPAIDQSVVVLRDDLRGTNAADKSIVAYVVCNLPDLPVTELRNFLRETLPEYMIPNAFVMLDEIPLTPNLKVDRNALPMPNIGSDQVTPNDDTPRDSVERQIASIWKKTLGVNTLGLDDDFFNVGGHSLLAARMIRDVEKLYGHRLPLATLLQAPSVRQFADVIKHQDWQPAWHCLVPIQESGSKPPLFLIHAAHGNVLLYRELAKKLGKDQPVYGLQAKGLDGKDPAHTTVQEMAAEYVAEIRKVQPSGPYHLGGYCLGGTIAYEVAQQLIADDEEVGLLALLDTHSRWFQSSIPARLYSGFQQIAFHGANVVMSGPRGVGAFLREKASQFTQRLGRRISVTRSKLGYAIGLRKETPLLLLERINDRASEEYIPQHYAGKLTVFKPCKAYLGYEDSSLGWGNGLVRDLEVIELPVFPAGMLIEPFVQELAIHLQRCLDDSNSPTVVAMPDTKISA